MSARIVAEESAPQPEREQLAKDIRDRARELYEHCMIGTPLTPIGVALVQALRSRLNDPYVTFVGSEPFERAWAEAWAAAAAATGYRRERTDYAAIAEEAADPDAQPVEVSEEELDEMLGCVPPIYVPGGFLVGEPLTGHATGTVFAHYARRDDRCLARYAIHGRPETYIKA